MKNVPGFMKPSGQLASLKILLLDIKTDIHTQYFSKKQPN